jgi:hypothetical protein
LDDRLPRADLVTQAFGSAQYLLGGALVGPEIGRAGLLVQLVEALLLGS